MHQLHEKSPVSYMVNVARLPQKGMQIVIDADEKQRRALAEAHELLSVEKFRAELLVASWKRNGVKVSGTLRADITQACVVTLDPLIATIKEDVEGLYLPEDSKLGRLGFNTPGEIVIDVEGPDSPELFSGDSIDVGALAEEFFGLAIDPYPRKPGASLAPSPPDGDEPTPLAPLREKLRSLTRKT